MKVKKAVDICKKRNVLRLYDSADGQWLSDGGVIYPLFELPEFTEDTICLAYDINIKKAASMVITRDHNLPEGINFEDAAKDEKQVVEGPMDLNYRGQWLKPIITSQGIEFINGEYLKPLSDISDEGLLFFERISDSGNKYFAVKQGLLIVAIIFPMRIIDEEFVKEIQAFATLCEASLHNKKSSLQL